MENFGLVIYLERNLLLEPSVRSQAAEQLVVKIISHEISHQVSEFLFSRVKYYFFFLKKFSLNSGLEIW